MKLETKKDLVARALKVGKNRIVFNTSRLSELKEAITKQDIRDLKESGAIHIKEIHGRKTHKKRKTRKRFGSIKKKIKGGKKQYIKITRKLRSYLAYLKKTKQISQENYLNLRKEIRASTFRSLAHMKERISQIGTLKTEGVKNAKNTKAKKTRKKN
jgi:large subunit ribosomal protein L19e